MSTIVQLTVLAPLGAADSAAAAALPDQAPLCVANTHLFFHPRAAHIRYFAWQGRGHRNSRSGNPLQLIARMGSLYLHITVCRLC